MKDYEVIQALSGKGEYGRAKAGFGFYHERMGSDGSVRRLDDIYIEKPEIRIFMDHSNFVRVDFVYDYPDDMDLLQQYLFLERYFEPKHSAAFDNADMYVKQVLNREIFDVNLLDAIGDEDGVEVTLLNGEVCAGGTIRVLPEKTLSLMDMEFTELSEEDEKRHRMLDIQEIASLKLDGEVIWARDMEIGPIPEEMQGMEGLEVTSDGKLVLFTHALTLNISSLLPRGKFTMTTRDVPMYYSLVPAKPNEEKCRVIRMVFKKEDVLFQTATEEEARMMEQKAMEDVETHPQM